MKTMFKSTYKFAAMVLTIAAVALNSCVKEGPVETYPAVEGASCTDKIQNGTEYKVDCGGPSCAPCEVGNPALTVTVDSTWIIDSNKTQNRFWTARYVQVNNTTDPDNIIVIASDTFPNNSGFISMAFKIPRSLERGVYEVSNLETYERYVSFAPGVTPGSARLQSGVISITSRDDVNGYISGKFEFISEPVDPFLYRVALLDGEFIDVPTQEPK
ncbi:MAG: DUF6252 family protein [Vicingaceae bacterium]